MERFSNALDLFFLPKHGDLSQGMISQRGDFLLHHQAGSAPATEHRCQVDILAQRETGADSASDAALGSAQPKVYAVSRNWAEHLISAFFFFPLI